MQIHVLGSAAGGGVPQWNCDCVNCRGARDGRLPIRAQDSLAVTGDRTSWVLLNASTDLRAQVAREVALRPSAGRRSPIAAVVLTDANIDHAAGLLDLRQAGSLRVISTPIVRDVLTANPMFAPFARAPRTWETPGDHWCDVPGMRVRLIDVPGLLPSFAGGIKAHGAASAVVIEDADGARLVYAPVFSDATEALIEAARTAGAAYFDGTFWTDDEMTALGMSSRSARDMGHAPLDGDQGSLDRLASAGCPRAYLTHVNSTNPLLDPSSAAAARASAAGFAVARDGDRLTVGPRTLPAADPIARA